MNVILGSRGRLGRVLVAAYPPGELFAPDRADYADWWKDDGAEVAEGYLRQHCRPGDVVMIAAGMIDPAQPATLHDQVNFRLPVHVIDAADRLGLRVLTFGTVMEKIVPANTDNPYYASKIRLGAYIEQLALARSVLHVRIHTLFGGGPPDRFMFLGQIAAALQAGTEFRMTGGTQLREYHHIDDEAVAIKALAASPMSGTVTLSHGNPMTLKALAEHVFTAFGCPDQLKIGALPSPSADNFQQAFERPDVLREIRFREPLAAVMAYLEQVGCVPTADNKNKMAREHS